MAKNNELKGKRIELVRCNDPYTKLKPGPQGTVVFVDDLGTVHVNWDNGATLGLCAADGDDWKVI